MVPRPPDPWTRLDRQLVLSAKPWLDVWRETVRLPDGRIIPDYYQLGAPDAAAIVAITPDGGVLAARQYRHGAGDAVWMLPAGFVDDGEPPLAAAKRELTEETGYEAAQWIELGTYVRDVNRGHGLLHVFLALDARKTSEPVDCDLQDFVTEQMPMDELLERIRLDRAKGLAVVAALLLAKVHLEQNPPIASDRGRCQ